MGVSVLRPRLLAFVISAFFTAVAGSLYAHFLGSFSPNVFYFDITFQVVTMLVVGGMGSVSGSVIGATVMLGLGEALRRIEDPTQLYGIGGIVLAAFLIVVIIFRPDGHHGSARDLPRRLFALARRPGSEPRPTPAACDRQQAPDGRAERPGTGTTAAPSA